MLVDEQKKQALLKNLAEKYPGRDKATIYRIEMVQGRCTMLCPGGVAIDSAVASALSRFGEERVVSIELQ